jgi:hypothetical protein
MRPARVARSIGNIGEYERRRTGRTGVERTPGGILGSAGGKGGRRKRRGGKEKKRKQSRCIRGP